MSNFLTKIPVNVERATKLLPKHSIVESVEWDGNDLLMRWSNHMLVTPWTFHAAWPLELLEAKRLPQGVAERQPKKPAPVMTPEPVGVAKGARRRANSPRR